MSEQDKARIAGVLAVSAIIFVLALGIHVALSQGLGGTNSGNLVRVPITTVANLPACNAGFAGVIWGVTDQATTVAYNGAVTGGGANLQHVYCNGTAWVQQ